MSSEFGPSYFLPTTGYLGIRAQKGEPINTKLPRLKTQVAGASEEIWVAYASLYFIFFSFLFFSFLFFPFPSFFFWSRLFLLVYFVLFSFGSGCYLRNEAECRNQILFKSLPGMCGISDKFLEFYSSSFLLQSF